MITLAILGEGRISQKLRDHGAPFGAVQIVGSEADAVLIDLPQPERAAAVITALKSGQTVLCPPPVALTEAELAAIAAIPTGRLLPAGELAHTEAVRHGLAAIADPAFGDLRSLYLSIRQPRGSGGDVLADLLPEALDTLLSILPGPFPTVRVNAASLFGDDRDTAVILLRSDTHVVVTLELSRCLPATLPACGLGEVEIDAMGALQSVRIVPGAGAVRIHRDDGVDHRPWLDAPVLAMLRTLEAPPGDGLARATAAFGLMKAIRAAA
jgi:predicted dehydrogenase